MIIIINTFFYGIIILVEREMILIRVLDVNNNSRHTTIPFFIFSYSSIDNIFLNNGIIQLNLSLLLKIKEYLL
jgi:hypothetical protein